jgi:integrase
LSGVKDRNQKHVFERIGDRVSIFERGRNWYANFQADGKQCRRSLRTKSEKEARRKANKLEAELFEGRYQQPHRSPTIGQVVTEYRVYLCTEDRAAKTLAKIDLVCRRVLDLARRRNAKTISDINLAFIDQYRNERVARKAMPKTRQNETVIIRQLVNFALRRKLIAVDPLQGLKIKKVKSPRQPCWSWPDVLRILDAAKEPQQSLLVVLAETGMRIGEAKWLEWDDVLFEQNAIVIRPKAGWKPKTGEERLVPMSERVRGMLEKRPRPHRWVFTARASRQYPNGDHQISERRTLEYLKRVLKRLSLPGHLHTFRHSFISRALTSGTPEATLRNWVGHVDANVTKIYTHILPQESQAAMQRLDAPCAAQKEV